MTALAAPHADPVASADHHADAPARAAPDDPLAGAAPGDPRQVRAWAQAVEAGVLAHAARVQPDLGWRGDASEEELLAIEERGRRAQQAFVAANLGLVGLVVRGQVRGAEPVADLFQEGCLGLMVAVERFDHRRGVRFSTYAAYWIRAFVAAAAARQTGAVTIPVSRSEQLRVALGTQSALAQELGRMPTGLELAEAIGRDRRWTLALLGQRGTRSIDDLDDERLHRFAASGADDAGTNEREDAVWARRLLAGLGAFERRVVELRLGFGGLSPASRPAVARELGVPLGRVRRAEVRAYERLRERCPRAVLTGVAS